LKDHSTNGTYVTAEGDSEMLLQREELTLRKHGWIAFGQPRSGTSEVVEYFCDRALAGERAGTLQVAAPDRIQRPVGEGPDGPRRVVAAVLRKRARADHEDVRHGPALQILVDRAGRGVGSHDRAARVVRALVGDDGVLLGARGDVHLRRADRLG